MRLRMNQAIALAIAEEMERDPDVVVFGEDVAVAEGPLRLPKAYSQNSGPIEFATLPFPRRPSWAQQWEPP